MVCPALLPRTNDDVADDEDGMMVAEPAKGGRSGTGEIRRVELFSPFWYLVIHFTFL